MPKLTRRSVLAAGTAMAALAATGSAQAQAKPKMRFSSAFTENDLRTEAYKAFAAAMSDAFDFEPYWG
ncbi:MAG TPA: twin-arginine translocation signal domain-containing protein, partial [Burkholderiaceae bacterium]|nr:twin-arginine translocation signal domain-containing protein [Burkholderiaceae bacterium]